MYNDTCQQLPTTERHDNGPHKATNSSPNARQSHAQSQLGSPTRRNGRRPTRTSRNIRRPPQGRQQTSLPQPARLGLTHPARPPHTVGGQTRTSPEQTKTQRNAPATPTHAKAPQPEQPGGASLSTGASVERSRAVFLLQQQAHQQFGPKQPLKRFL